MNFPRPLIIAGAATILVLGIAAAVLVLDDSDERARTLESYYFEARLEVVELEDSSPLGVKEPRPDLIRVWYEAPDKWRQEFTFSDPKQRDLASVNVSDGQRMWRYDGEVNSYYVQDLPQALPESARGTLGTIIGSVLGPLSAPSLEEFFARYEGAGANWRRLRTERVLGVEAQVIEMDIGGDKTTFWIDPRYLFVLRYESGEKGVSEQWIKAEITELQYDTGVEAERFKFEPPAGAKEVPRPSNAGSTSGSSGPIGGREVTVPAGFLAPAYLPDGYVSVGQGSSHSSGGTTGLQLRFQPATQRSQGGGPYLLLEEQQRFGGLPESLKTGQLVSVRGSEGYLSASDGVNKLAWWINDFVITLTSNTLQPDELSRIAESMR